MFGDSGKKHSKLLMIDWDAHKLRMAHVLFGKRGVKIERLLASNIPHDVDSNIPDQMGGHIRKVLEQEGIATRYASVDIPRDQAILNTLRLPVAARDELPGMVQIQITKELPFPIGDAAIDFVIGEQIEGTPTAEVLVAAVRREVLEQYVATLEAAGLKLDRIGLRPYANKVAICELLRHAIPERVIFIDVRPTQMEIDVFRNSALVFSRSAEVALEGIVEGAGEQASDLSKSASEVHEQKLRLASSANLDSPSPIIQSLVLEVTRSIEAYRASDPGANFDYVVIGGDVGVEESLAAVLQQRLGATTQLYNPASSFGWEPDQGVGASAFSATLGLALSYTSDELVGFDFLHPKRSESKSQKRLKKAPAIAAVIALFLVTGILLVTDATAADRAKLIEVNAKIKALKADTRNNKKFLKLVDQVKAFDTQQVWVDLIYDVFLALPSNKEIVVDYVDMNQGDNRLTLKTRAKRRDTASQLITTLNNYQRTEDSKKCFSVFMRTQTENVKNRYPFSQDLVVRVLCDGKYGGDSLHADELEEHELKDAQLMAPQEVSKRSSRSSVKKNEQKR